MHKLAVIMLARICFNSCLATTPAPAVDIVANSQFVCAALAAQARNVPLYFGSRRYSSSSASASMTHQSSLLEYSEGSSDSESKVNASSAAANTADSNLFDGQYSGLFRIAQAVQRAVVSYLWTLTVPQETILGIEH